MHAEASVVQMARCEKQGQVLAIKFYMRSADFLKEKALCWKQYPPTGPSLPQELSVYLPQVHRIVGNAENVFLDSKRKPLPPCIVFERGESLLLVGSRRRALDMMASYTVRFS